MGSSGSGAADCAVGSIVWVRRRNGSWWPGKILGPEELSVSHLLSPRSGTPVKLLGREDASVDWYNLEKSKRVKAFRCGEFEDCIERAESSQGTPIKKREKYARREDAILHALELEKQLLIKQGKLLGATSDKSSSVRSSANLGNYKGKYGNPKSHQFSKKLDTAHQDEIIGSPLCLQDDNSEAIPQMRGLQDSGVRIAPSKRKLSSSPNGCERPSIDSTSQALPVHDLNMGRANHGTVSTSFSGVEHMGAVSRAKRSKCVYLPTESSDYLDQKEILANYNDILPSQFGEGNFGPQLGSFLEENASGFMEDVDLDSSGTNFSKSDTDDDSSETEPETDKEMALLSEADPYALARPEVLGEYRTLNSEEPADSGDTSLHYPLHHVPPNEAMCKWKSKGKRNARSLPGRHTDASNRKVVDFGQRALRHNISFLGNDDFNDSVGCDWNEMDMIEPGNGAYPLPSRYSQGSAWEDKQQNFLGHRHVGMRARSVLVDVDLKVQASYQKEHVPIVSLMSKLNGKAIIGHPIQIEILEDGSTTTLLSTINSLSNKTLDDENNPLPQAWRTARRSANSRVPKNGPHRFLKKLPKSGPSLSGQKTRTLSSITVERKRVGVIDGEIKGESTGITTVACIPIKLVFSRLLEKINRPHQPRL